MSDMAYIMETQDPHELWLVDGENKFKVSWDMYWLLVSQGADLPRVHDISDLLAENATLRSMRDTWQENDAKLREQNSELRKLVADLWTHCPADRYYCALCEYGNDDGSECKLADRMRKLGIEDG